MQELKGILGSIKELSGLIIAAIVFVLLLIFRPEVRKLVDWVVRLRRISKTRDGYAVEAGREPEQLPELQESKEERKITELQETVPTSDKEVPKATVNAGREKQRIPK